MRESWYRPGVALILQLSDLHLLSGAEHEAPIQEALVAAVRAETHRRQQPVSMMAITGDVFDSSTVEPERAIEAFRALHGRMTDTLGGHVPTVIVPGNHDRRRMGWMAPFHEGLFRRLGDTAQAHLFVHGGDVPFLARVVPPRFHGLPLWVVAYDSTYVPTGMFSAGGVLRQEDLLHAAAEIGDAQPDWPVLFLLHHHLVPTPLTDVGKVDVTHVPPMMRWTVEHMLPSLVANIDREELTMTAMGSGTALSTLHSMGRAVIVLHGHKHYANARLLKATTAEQGDVMLVSAGSSGLAQAWFPTTGRDAARLWPSFNLLDIDENAAAVDVVSFGYKGEARGDLAVRPMVRARRDGARWLVGPVAAAGEAGGTRRLERNELVVRLTADPRSPRWNLTCFRHYEGSPTFAPKRFTDTVDALEDGEVYVLDASGSPIGEASHPPVQLELVRNQPVHYRIDRGLCRTVDEAYRLFGKRWTPYAWLGIMNRYASRIVRLEVHEPQHGTLRQAFGSETDLGTGLQRVRRGHHEHDRFIVEYPDCPPRTLLRVFWPLARS